MQKRRRQKGEQRIQDGQKQAVGVEDNEPKSVHRDITTPISNKDIPVISYHFHLTVNDKSPYL